MTRDRDLALRPAAAQTGAVPDPPDDRTGGDLVVEALAGLGVTTDCGLRGPFGIRVRFTQPKGWRRSGRMPGGPGRARPGQRRTCAERTAGARRRPYQGAVRHRIASTRSGQPA